jgi:hypothetical protein
MVRVTAKSMETLKQPGEHPRGLIWVSCENRLERVDFVAVYEFTA